MSQHQDNGLEPEEDRWVRIMGLGDCATAWSRDGAACCIPVSESLEGALDRWGEWGSHDELGDPDLTFDVEAFAAEGLRLARAVKAELPTWTVIYHDAAAAERVIPLRACVLSRLRGGPDIPLPPQQEREALRPAYEYEITLPAA